MTIKEAAKIAEKAVGGTLRDYAPEGVPPETATLMMKAARRAAANSAAIALMNEAARKS